MLDRNRPVQTISGLKVTIYEWDANGFIHGRIHNWQYPSFWDTEGVHQDPHVDKLNLVNVPKPKIRIERYIYVFRDGSTPMVREPVNMGFWYHDKPLACKHIVFEIEEGQFDE